GSPTEAALLLLFKKAHLDEMNIHKQYNEVFEYPFDSTLKRMTKVFRTGDQYIVSCKGATEFILSLSSRAILGGNVETLTEEDREEISRETQGFEGEGYRILSFAYKFLPEIPSEWNDARDTFESDLIFLGFVCILDPPRAGVSKSIEECKDAGIKVIMVTGDSALTAQTIGQEVGIYKEGDRVIEGNQIETLTAEELSQATVFARVSPKHKETIISKLQEGEKKVIAMTGDGVNDALALHLADVGIAMGVKGTDVAKQAADIMLIDDSFTSIVDGIHEGRSLFTKIRTLVYFYVGINLMEAIVLFMFSFNPATNFQFLLPFQYYFLLLTSHNFTGFGIAFDKRDPDVMKQPPRDSEGILSKQLFGAMIIQTIMVGACVAFMYILSSGGAIPILPDASGLFPRQNMVFDVTSDTFVMATIPQKAITMTMVTIIISEVLWAFSARRLNKSALGTMRKDLSFWFVILCLCAPAAAFLWPIAVSILPFVQTLLVHLGIDLQIVELGVRDWLACIGVALIGFVAFELWKWFLRRRNVHL
ncbi:MAG TPA: HAD-IC family P-type ATPase, partial [Candidatus Lokiarchaeia archaeon]|nr:HAD-IC family P-type ATPase [Candidatus Lokiarchaeia archaeon]